MNELQQKVEAMRLKSLERAEAEAARRREVAEENRRRMPTVSEWVDGMKAVFGGDQVKVAFASENGITLGTPGPAGVKLSETVVGPFNKPKPEGRRK